MSRSRAFDQRLPVFGMFGRFRMSAAFGVCAALGACASGPGRDALEPPDLRSLPGLSPATTRGSTAGTGPDDALRAPAEGSLPLAATPGSAPVSVEAAAPDASWTVVCEAREDTNQNGTLDAAPGPRGLPEGDRLARYLELPNGEIVAIDALVDRSPAGRYLVVRRAGRVELIDSTSGSLRELAGVEPRFEATLPARKRVALLDGALYYLRRNGAHGELVELTLPSGPERALYTTSDDAFGLELDPSGAYLVLEVAGADRNGNGRIDRPSPGDGEARPCGGTAPEVRARRPDLDSSGFVLVPREGGKPRRVDDLALVFGKDLIRRRADQALLLERDGKARVIADDKCRGRVLFAEPERNLILLGCVMPKKPSRLSVELLAGGSRRLLPIDVADLAVDEPARPGTRLFPLYPGPDTMLFDAERQSLRRFEPGDLVLAVAGERALIRRGRTALIYDAKSDRTLQLPGKLDALSEAIQTGPVVHASPLVVDLASGRSIGNISGRSLAVSLSGEVLLAAVPASAETLARGPLLWHAPEPIR